MLGMKMVGVVHCHPLNFQLKKGHKTGVGKKANECVGTSISTCRPQAENSQSGRFRRNQIKRNTIRNTMKLCVTLYR